MKGLAAGLQRVLSSSDPVAEEDYHSFAGNQDVHLRVCDVSSLESVKAFAAEHERSGRPLHVLVNNAGILVCFHGVHPASFLHAKHIFVFASNLRLSDSWFTACQEQHILGQRTPFHNSTLQSSEGRSTSTDGLELSFATNTLGAFALTRQLEPVLKRSSPSRVIFVSSGGMYSGGARMSAGFCV